MDTAMTEKENSTPVDSGDYTDSQIKDHLEPELIETLMDATNNPLRPSNLKDEIDSLFHSFLILSPYMLIVRGGPSGMPGGSPIIRRMNAQARLTKRSVESGKIVLVPGIMGALSDFFAYANRFVVLASEILKVISHGLPDNDNRQRAVRLVTVLDRAAAAGMVDARSLSLELASFRDQAERDYSVFQGLGDAARKELGEIPAKVAETLKQIEALQKKIDQGNFVGLESFGVPVVQGPRLDQALPFTGLAFIPLGAEGLADCENCVDNKRLGDLYAKLADFSTVLTFVEIWLGVTRPWSEAGVLMASSGQGAALGWAAIQAGLEDLKGRILHARSPSDVVFLETMLRLSIEEWRRLRARVAELFSKMPQPIFDPPPPPSVG